MSTNSFGSLLVSLVAFCLVGFTHESGCKYHGTLEFLVPNQEQGLARQALEHWKTRFETKADWLNESPFTNVDSNTDDSRKKLLQDYRDAWSLVDLDHAIKLVNQIESTDMQYVHQAKEQLFRYAYGSGQQTLVQSMIDDEEYPAVYQEFLVDMANFSITRQRSDLYQAAVKRLKAIPAVHGFRPATASSHLFYAAAARLEWLRKPGTEVNSIQVESAATELRIEANGLGTISNGSTAKLARLKNLALNYANLESWGTGPAESSALGSDDMNAILSPLTRIGGQVLWPVEIELPALDDASVMPWISRQLFCERHDVAVAFVLRAGDRSKYQAIHRARLLAVISKSLHSLDKLKAEVCRDVSEQLLALAEPRIDKGQFSDLLLMETKAEIALALNAHGHLAQAKEMLQSTIQDWDAYLARRENKTRTFGVDTDAFFALLDAIATMQVPAKQLSEPMIAEITDWVGDARMSYPGNITSRNCPVSVRNVERLVDLSEVCSIPQSRCLEEKFPLVYEYADAENWSRSISELRQQMEKQTWLTSTAIGRHQCRTVFQYIARRSIERSGLQKTLEWAASVKDDSIRMTIELDAILQTLDSSNSHVPKRRLPTSFVPLRLVLSAC